jgi:hypothetical protein
VDSLEQAAEPGGDSFVLRRGVTMPDWSFATEASARTALGAVMADAGRARKWAGLESAEDQVWQAILRGFAAGWSAPDARSLAVSTGLDQATIGGLMHSLRRRDLIVLGADGAVTAAYPFCAWDSGHRVRLGGPTVNSLCAIDALGVGAMVGEDISIESSCSACRAAIRVVTVDRGLDLSGVTPAGAVVWSGLRYADGCAATSGCTVKLFFCSDEHLMAWRRRADPDGAGLRLSMEAAFQVAKAIFVPMLADGSDDAGGMT